MEFQTGLGQHGYDLNNVTSMRGIIKDSYNWHIFYWMYGEK